MSMELNRHLRHAPNISKGERVASLIGGAALALYGIRKRSRVGYAMAVVGGDLIRRGTTGYCYFYQAIGLRTAAVGQGAHVSVPYQLGIRVDQTITVKRPREEVYRFWRQLDNLPRFMRHLEAIQDLGGNRSHWIAKGPADRTVEWDAEIINEKEGELIGWRSLEGADVENAGSVSFRDALGGRGTKITVELQYNPPAGALGAAVAKLLGKEPSQQITEDLRRFKALMETRDVPITEGQPTMLNKTAESHT